MICFTEKIENIYCNCPCIIGIFNGSFVFYKYVFRLLGYLNFVLLCDIFFVIYGYQPLS